MPVPRRARTSRPPVGELARATGSRQLDGRVALVTGAARGIGFGTASHLADLGMIVALNDVRDDVVAAAELLARQGASAIPVIADVTSRGDVQSMVDRVERDVGPIWLLVNNAGAYASGATIELPEADWELAMAVGAKSVFLCSQAVLGGMTDRRGGRIVNISSIAGSIVRTGQIAYCSAKAAVNHLTRCLAVEVAAHGITVNAILPGMTATDMLGSVTRRELDAAEIRAMVPDGRLATPHDHAAVVGWLASDEASHVTGQLIAVDGGQSLLLPFVADSTAALLGATERADAQADKPRRTGSASSRRIESSGS